MGPVLPFIAIAIGQAAGAPAIGLAIEQLGYGHAFALFSTIGLFVATLSPMYPQHFDHGEDEPSDAEDGVETESAETTRPATEGANTE